MPAIVIGLFLMASVSLITAMYGQLAALAGLVEQMKAHAESGGVLSWHIATTIPSWTLDVARYMGPATFLAGMLAAIYFVFSCRASHRTLT